MEVLEEIIKLSIGGTTVGIIIVYLGKFFLTKSSDLLMENHKNQLEISKTEHQVRFSKLHSERGEIIKSIYLDLYELEKKLEHLTTLFQGPEWKTDKERDDDARAKYKETFERLENNRIYFSEELCNQISLGLENYNNIIQLMFKAKNKAHYESDGTGYRFPDGQGSLDLWKEAENKTKNEIRQLRFELANVFRKLIGV
ncbi:hypothetical protein [Flavobacterium soyangense]|uniref:Uncharacterized protein n=1 Tax=Flavobacterium soyangense TaxID=2023265 RepID=A0A930UAN4_9FLAO|nr:hypothetical protein [Flavobacterium soyangense]MBF2707816.1 hypothetical protein [Flavobacterium soyangense]